MKRFLLILTLASVVVSIQSCKSKPKDEDIKKSVETALAADPSLMGINVSIQDGVATLTGEVRDENSRITAQNTVASVKGVKSVTNNTTVYTPPPVVPPTADETLQKSVNDAIKDYPGVKATVTNQVVTLTGEIAKSDLQKLMMSLNGLKDVGLKSIDSKGLVKK